MTDEKYIKIALSLAKKGKGKVSPNPLVGCVIVKNNKIIGKGYHNKFGGNHAEINAINSAKTKIKGSTVYITLEPCSFLGKTPPCVDRLIKEKVKRVVIGTIDPNPLVKGNGIAKLKKANIDVKTNVFDAECIKINKFFNKFITKKLPYVTLKSAITLDGFIADEKNNSKWISSEKSRKYVHSLRSEYDAVLIGSNTAKIDNPQLNVRLVKGRSPKKIILDSKLSISKNSNLFNDIEKDGIIIFTSTESKVKKNKIHLLNELGAKIIFVKKDSNDNLNLKTVLRKIGKLNIASVLVEGGSKIYNSFIKQNLFDEINLFICPKIIGKGKNWTGNMTLNRITKSSNLNISNVKKIGNDVLLVLNKKVANCLQA